MLILKHESNTFADVSSFNREEERKKEADERKKTEKRKKETRVVFVGLAKEHNANFSLFMHVRTCNNGC